MSLNLVNPYRFGVAQGVEFKVGSFNKSTNTSTPVDQAITGVGFTPKALILFSSQVSGGDQDTLTDDLEFCMGFSDGTTEKSLWVGSEDGVATSDSDRIMYSGKILGLRNISSATSGALIAECDLKTFDADGFTLTWTTNDASATSIKYIAIGGDDITGVEVGNFTSPASATPQVQNVSTGLSNADFVMVMGTAITAASQDSLTTHANVSLGMATADTEEGLTNIRSENAQGTSDTSRYQRTNNFASVNLVGDGSVFELGSFDGFTASGFDIDWTTTTTTAFNFYYLTIKGGSWEVGNGTTPTTATTKAYTTAFEPRGLMLTGFTNAATTSVVTAVHYHLGGADGTNNVGIGLTDEDGQATTDSYRISSNTKCLQNMVTNAVFEEASLDSFNATDFTLDFSVANATAREFIWFVVGDT